MTLTELQIERTCSDLLALDGWRSLKTDPVSRKEWGKGFGELGMADRLYIRYRKTWPESDVRHDGFFPWDAEVMWIEWKRIKGKNATKATTKQAEWHQAERARGAFVLLAGLHFPASIDGFKEFYRNSGLMRSAFK